MSMAMFKYLVIHLTWRILPKFSADASLLNNAHFKMMHFWSTVHSNFIFNLQHKPVHYNTFDIPLKCMTNKLQENIIFIYRKKYLLRLEKLWFRNWSFFFDPSIDTTKVIFRISFYGFYTKPSRFTSEFRTVIRKSEVSSRIKAMFS